MAYLATDHYIGRSLELYGEYAEDEMDLLGRLVPEGGVAVDAGANIGTHTVFLARHVGPKGVVIAFEPQRVIHQILCANAALNRLTNTYALWEAVGDRSGRVLVPRVDYDQPQNFGGLSLLGTAAGEQVRLNTIDGLGLPACHLIKIDVEGMEPAVLDGARATIGRYRPALYIETDRPQSYSEILKRLFDLGYRVWQHRARLFNRANFFANPHNEFGGTIALNVLALPRERAASIELRELTSPDDGLQDLLQMAGGREGSTEV